MREVSKEEYESLIRLMASYRGHGDDPKVGIFWYNTTEKDIFGIVSLPLLIFTRANAKGWVSCSETHEEAWWWECSRQARRGGFDGPFIGFYDDYPRGRVFYHMEEDRYVVAVGKWIEEYPEAKELILAEFDLPADKTTFEYAIHWDIGQTWR